MTQEKRVITKKYSVSAHAIKRLFERCNIPNHQAVSYVNQLMIHAVYKGTAPNVNGEIARVFDHYKSGVRLKLDEKKDEVITVQRLETVKQDGKVLTVKVVDQSNSLTVNRLATAIKREFKRMQTEALRDIRKMKEEYAAMYVEIAQLKYNKIRCRAPHTQLIIQTKIDELVAKTSELTKVIDAKLTEIERAKSEVKAVAGE